MADETVLPAYDSVSEPFWQATSRGVLTCQQCRTCRSWVFYPREFCPACSGTDLQWQEVPSSGVVYSLSIHHGGKPEDEPYVVALVDVVPGMRLLTNIVGPDALGAVIGSDVVLEWQDLADGRKLPLYRLVGQQSEVSS